MLHKWNLSSSFWSSCLLLVAICWKTLWNTGFTGTVTHGPHESTNMIKCNKNVCTDVPASLWCLRLSFRLTVTAQFTVYSQGEKTKLSQISLEEKLEAKSKNRILVLTLQLRRVFSRDLKTVGEAEVLIQRARTSRVCSCESSDCQSGQREQRRQ